MALLFVFGFCKINNTISTCKEKNNIIFIRKIDTEIAILPECVGIKNKLFAFCVDFLLVNENQLILTLWIFIFKLE